MYYVTLFRFVLESISVLLSKIIFLRRNTERISNTFLLKKYIQIKKRVYFLIKEKQLED
jgi:hypothetical protein